jgi:hypothetical protein
MSQNSRNQGFFCYFCLMAEGSGSVSVPQTNGSGGSKTYGSGSELLIEAMQTQLQGRKS